MARKTKSAGVTNKKFCRFFSFWCYFGRRNYRSLHLTTPLPCLLPTSAGAPRGYKTRHLNFDLTSRKYCYGINKIFLFAVYNYNVHRRVAWFVNNNH